MEGKKANEFVLVFPTSLLQQLGKFQGLRLATPGYVDAIEAASFYKPRYEAESDPAFKQVIPYVLVEHDLRFLSYRRGARSSEERLKGARSIGIGGHISSSDPNLLRSAYVEGMNREIHEELRIQGRYAIRAAAMLNDDSDEVGMVHFGLIHVMTLEDPVVSSREQAIADLQFMDVEELIAGQDQYENWSQICIRHLPEIVSAPGGNHG